MISDQFRHREWSSRYFFGFHDFFKGKKDENNKKINLRSFLYDSG